LTTELAWVISANMGLGHQRATYPLRNIAYRGVHLFGESFIKYPNERRLWTFFRKSYEFISRTKDVPIIGPPLYSFLEKLQNISPYYPFRDRSRPSFQVKSLYSMIKRGMGHGFGLELNSKKIPVVTSFYAAAIAAEELTDLPVYCIICDTDINRVWVAKDPKKSRIVYFAPCGRAARRLKQYGVPDERILLTGFPLPQENIGPEMCILCYDLTERLTLLDPTHRFRDIHGEGVKYYLKCGEALEREPTRPVSITYAVGGAGAQTEIAGDIINSLAPRIREGSVCLNLVAGVRKKVYDYFINTLKKAGIDNTRGVNIIFDYEPNEYFRKFNSILHTTDLLWTKPSELTFYCGLGIPIIMAPSIGPHEVANRKWLQEVGAGIPQNEPKYCWEWITDYLVDGKLARAAWDGFLYARSMGTYKILEVLTTGAMKVETSPIKR